MACFVVPLAQAVATSIYRKHSQKSESISIFSQQLPKLETMLYGGSAMLIVDHAIAGEIMPSFPFFSALLTEGGAMEMLREMLTVGLPMSIFVTLIWGCICAVSAYKLKRG